MSEQDARLLQDETDSLNAPFGGSSAFYRQGSPPVFLGLPVIVGGRPGAELVFDPALRHVVPCQRLDRPDEQQWDLFDLIEEKAFNTYFATQEKARAAALELASETDR